MSGVLRFVLTQVHMQCDKFVNGKVVVFAINLYLSLYLAFRISKTVCVKTELCNTWGVLNVNGENILLM